MTGKPRDDHLFGQRRRRVVIERHELEEQLVHPGRVELDHAPVEPADRARVEARRVARLHELCDIVLDAADAHGAAHLRAEREHVAATAGAHDREPDRQPDLGRDERGAIERPGSVIGVV